MTRTRERGSAMLVTMIVIAALLAGAAVLVSMQMSSNRSTELTRNGLAALYCAEAGLAIARTAVPVNYGNWDATLSANCTDDGDCNTLVEPAWLAVLSHDIGDGGAPDFTLSIRDNDDEIASPNGADDSDEKVFIVARCTKYPDSPRVVEELIHYKPALNVLDCQAGGGTGAGTDIGNTDTCGGF